MITWLFINRSTITNYEVHNIIVIHEQSSEIMADLGEGSFVYVFKIQSFIYNCFDN